MVLLRIIALSILCLLFSGCSFIGLESNFNDGTWSNCTYTSNDGRIIKTPLRVGGQPLTWVEPDGTKVECIPIPFGAPEPSR